VSREGLGPAAPALRDAGRTADRRSNEVIATEGGPSVARQGRLSPQLRKLVLAAHVVVSVSWLGVVAAMLVLEIAAATAQEAGMAEVTYALVGDVSDTLVAPPPASLSIAALLTGIVLSLGTRWGLLEHYWVLVKLLLTVAVVLSGLFLVEGWIRQASAAPQGPAPMLLICVSVIHLLMLGAATIISVYQPWGTMERSRRGAAPRRTPRGADGGARIASSARAPGGADAAGSHRKASTT
jgi:hypothetical protein